MTTPKTLNIRDWAKQTCEQHIADIKKYIDLGWTKEKAIEKVFNSSTIGSAYKAQIRYEFK